MKFRFSTKRAKKTVDMGALLPDIVSELNISESFVIEDIRSKWYNIAGEIIAAHSIPDRIFKNILFVSTDHSVYANELTMMKDVILERIRNEIPAASVNSIKMEIKKLKWDNR